jgi:hypothetical protein
VRTFTGFGSNDIHKFNSVGETRATMMMMMMMMMIIIIIIIQFDKWLKIRCVYG